MHPSLRLPRVTSTSNLALRQRRQGVRIKSLGRFATSPCTTMSRMGTTLLSAVSSNASAGAWLASPPSASNASTNARAAPERTYSAVSKDTHRSPCVPFKGRMVVHGTFLDDFEFVDDDDDDNVEVSFVPRERYEAMCARADTLAVTLSRAAIKLQLVRSQANERHRKDRSALQRHRRLCSQANTRLKYVEASRHAPLGNEPRRPARTRALPGPPGPTGSTATSSRAQTARAPSSTGGAISVEPPLCVLPTPRPRTTMTKRPVPAPRTSSALAVGEHTPTERRSTGAWAHRDSLGGGKPGIASVASASRPSSRTPSVAAPRKTRLWTPSDQLLPSPWAASQSPEQQDSRGGVPPEVMERIETLQFMLAMVAEDNRLLRTVLKETGNEAPLPAEWAEPVVPLGEPDSAAPSSSRAVRFRCIRCDDMTPHLVIDDIHGWFDKSFRAVLREARQSHQETVDEIREHYKTVESQLSSDNARLKKALQTAASCHEKNWRGEAELRAKNRNLKQELAAARRQIADLEEKVASFSTSR